MREHESRHLMLCAMATEQPKIRRQVKKPKTCMTLSTRLRISTSARACWCSKSYILRI